jgi:hypothetical protein
MNSALYFLYLAFFISHIPITLFVDSQAGEPCAMPWAQTSGADSWLLVPPWCSAAGVLVPPGPQGHAVVVFRDVSGPSGERRRGCVNVCMFVCVGGRRGAVVAVQQQEQQLTDGSAAPSF